MLSNDKKEFIKVKPLKIGDKIGILSPASPLEKEKIKKGAEFIKSFGFETEISKSSFSISKHSYMAGSIKGRIDDLHYMFKKDEIKAIICARGGYGSMRILEYIDYQLIRDNPKIFVGYSDTTALLMAIIKKAGIITFHGPMLKDIMELSNKYLSLFWNILQKKCKEIKAEKAKALLSAEKEIEGILLGGNLSMIASLVGTDYLPICKKVILFLEDINEPYYKIDRMLTQLRLSGFFKNVSALILGQFKDCGKKDIINQIVLDIVSDIGFPILYDFPIGHSNQNMLIPLGIRVRLNTEQKTITFLEEPFI